MQKKVVQEMVERIKLVTSPQYGHYNHKIFERLKEHADSLAKQDGHKLSDRDYWNDATYALAFDFTTLLLSNGVLQVDKLWEVDKFLIYQSSYSGKSHCNEKQLPGGLNDLVLAKSILEDPSLDKCPRARSERVELTTYL